MTKSEIAKLLLIVNGAFPQNQTNETTFNTWGVILAKVPMEFAEKALMAYIAKGSPFAPTAGQILQEARIIRDGVAPPAELALEMAIRGDKNLHPRIKEVLQYVDISCLRPVIREYNPHGEHVSAKDERFREDYARRAFIRSYNEGIDFEVKNHARELAAPERKLLENIQIKQIQ